MGKKLTALLLGVLTLGGIAVAASTLAAQEKNDAEESRASAPRVHVRYSRLGSGSYLGVMIAEVDGEAVRELSLPGEYGVLIENVEQDTPASKARFETKDVIVSWNGARMESTIQLRRVLEETPPGRTAEVGVIRGGKSRTLSVKLGESPHGNLFALRSGPGGTAFAPLVRERLQRNGSELRDHMRSLRENQMPKMRSFAFFGGGGRLGVSIQSLNGQLAEYFGLGDRSGVLISSVSEESAAAKAGLKAGDVIVSVDGEAVEDPGELMKAIHEAEQGPLNLRVLRDKSERSISVNLPEAPQGRLWTPGEEQSLYFGGFGENGAGEFDFVMPDLDYVWEGLEGLGNLDEVMEEALDGVEFHWSVPDVDIEVDGARGGEGEASPPARSARFRTPSAVSA